MQFRCANGPFAQPASATARCCTGSIGATLGRVPTNRPRHSITETDEVAAALEDAARRWPEDRESPGRLLTRLLQAGRAAIRGRDADDRSARLRSVEEQAGALTGVYPAGYLDELRNDWPA